MLQTHSFAIGQRIKWKEVFDDSFYPDGKAELITMGIIIALTFGDFNTFSNGDLLPDKSILNTPSYQILVEATLDNSSDEPDSTLSVAFIPESELIDYGVTVV